MAENQAGRYLLVVGNVGAGKTTLAATLARRLGVAHQREPFEANPFLPSFYRAPAAHAFRSQLWFLAAHHAQHRALAGAGWTVKDGSIFDSAEIVTRQMHRQGYLDADEWALYWRLYQALAAECAPPALTVWLGAETPVLLARVRARSRSFEGGVTADFLERMNAGYAEWAEEWRRSPLVRIDTSRLDAEAVAEAALEPVRAALAGA